MATAVVFQRPVKPLTFLPDVAVVDAHRYGADTDEHEAGQYQPDGPREVVGEMLGHEIPDIENERQRANEQQRA